MKHKSKPAASRKSKAPAPAQAIIHCDDPMAEAVRVVMARQSSVMRANEAGCRQGKDDDAIHDMRVAIRRLRVAFRLFGDYYRRSTIRPLEQELRQAGRMLGAVRDFDVMARDARAYVAVGDKAQRVDLAPLLSHWRDQRQKVHRQLVDYLDGDGFRGLLDGLEAFVSTPETGLAGKAQQPGDPYQVRHVLGSLVWMRYEAVRAYETVLPDSPPTVWHALRIACKYLRYSLEFFQEVLGEDTPSLIAQVISVQDHLGNLQDAEVAGHRLVEFLALAYRQQAAAATPFDVDLNGVTGYHSDRREAVQRLMAGFAPVWSQIEGVKFRRRLAAALETL